MQSDSFLREFFSAQDRLRAFLYAVTADFHETEDLLQEIAMILWRKFDQYDPARPFLAWALGIARLECMKWRRSQTRDRLVFSEKTLLLLSNSLTATGTTDERVPLLARCLRELSDIPREALRLRYEDNKRNSEIAAILNRSITVIEKMLQRARDALRACVTRKQRER